MQATGITVAGLGFPRIGARRELKFAVEAYWRGESTAAALEETARSLRTRHWQAQATRGVERVPVNDFSLYDQVLDLLVALGATPARFGSGKVDLPRYFKMARGGDGQPAMEMTKWFDTNYHYLVPEWSADLPFTVDPSKPVAELREALALGLDARPVLIGPVTLLALGKAVDGSDPAVLLPRLLAAYRQLIEALHAAGAQWVQIDEPILVTAPDAATCARYAPAYAELARTPVKLLLTTYFGGIEDQLDLLAGLPVAGLHVDLVRAPQQLDAVLRKWPAERLLSLGLVDGRNVWITDLERAFGQLDQALAARAATTLELAPSCSLLHVPIDTAGENQLPESLRDRLAFAVQKVEELALLAGGRERAATVITVNRQRRAAFGSGLQETDAGDGWQRASFTRRAERQAERFALPLLPTTTIGSFPQTAEVRKARADWRRGALATADYERFMEQCIDDAVARQEAIGLDVLVHGEFERGDMVEYFGELLDGFAFTAHGWVQSYGSRCVKPPLIHGDVTRPQPMTLRWTRYAQSRTARPVKGMLTGPVTILQWSFARDDLPRPQIARQIARVLRTEIADLEAAGVGMIQVDEPAFREGLPLRRDQWAGYLDWAVGAFRLATGGVDDATQIHTHMCYSEFGDILDAIAALDADVISIETTRSHMALLDDFAERGYPNAVGPGVYDIHSPQVPTVAAMRALLERACEVLPPERLWVNPDCGLKTRGWPEVEAALRAMVAAADGLREQLAATA